MLGIPGCSRPPNHTPTHSATHLCLALPFRGPRGFTWKGCCRSQLSSRGAIPHITSQMHLKVIPCAQRETVLSLALISARLHGSWTPPFQCFEGLKAYIDKEGRVRLFRPEMNAQRMRRSCRRIGLPVCALCMVCMCALLSTPVNPSVPLPCGMVGGETDGMADGCRG